MENMRIRNYAKDNGVKLWQIAEVYGCNDGNFSRKLRRELPKDEQKKIIGIIDTIAADQSK